MRAQCKGAPWATGSCRQREDKEVRHLPPDNGCSASATRGTLHRQSSVFGVHTGGALSPPLSSRGQSLGQLGHLTLWLTTPKGGGTGWLQG